MSDNVIHRLIFEIDLAENTSSNCALQQSERFYTDYVRPAIENVVNNYNHQYIYIDGREEVDLGHIQPGEIQDRLETLLHKVLQKYIQPISIRPVRTCHASVKPLQTGVFSGETDSLIPDTETDDVECFFNYLATPVLPWHAIKKGSFDIEHIAEKALKTIENDLPSRKRLLEVISKDKNMYARFSFFPSVTPQLLEDLIVQQFSVSTPSDNSGKINEQMITQIATKIDIRRRKKYYKTVLHELLFKEGANPDRMPAEIVRHLQHEHMDIKKDTIQTIKQTSFSKQNTNNPGTLAAEIVRHLKDEHMDIKKDTTQTIKQTSSSKQNTNNPDTLAIDIVRHLQDEYMDIKEDTTQITELVMDKTSVKDAIQKASHTLNSGLNENKILLQQREMPTTMDKESIGRIPIENGGLILLHPFLYSFFQRLGFLNKDNHFKSAKKQIRAVHLLQYMTGRKTKHFDHNLSFCKVLCGLNPFFAICPAFRATLNEQTEVNDLLQSVINHWSILGNTSIYSFQDTFIRRYGLLEQNEKDWIIRMENRGVDVLLEYLPWDIHLTTLPWNKYLIFTEWRYK